MKKVFTVCAFLLSFLGFAQQSTAMLDGVWVGKGYQFNLNESWSVVLTIDEGEYKIDYTSLSCIAELKLLQVNSNRVFFEEEMKKGHCIPDGLVELELINANSLRYKWSFSDGEPGAIAELYKF